MLMCGWKRTRGLTVEEETHGAPILFSSEEGKECREVGKIEAQQLGWRAGSGAGGTCMRRRLWSKPEGPVGAGARFELKALAGFDGGCELEVDCDKLFSTARWGGREMGAWR